MQKATVTIVGKSPLLMHNGQLSDPLNPFTKELKALTSKTKKTDEDHMAIAHAEWKGGLYLSEIDKKTIVIPSKMIEAVMVEGAKENKLGKAFKAAVLCPEMEYPLQYDGPKDTAKLWEEGYVLTTSVKVGTARCQRSRPIFPTGWSLTFDVEIDTDSINPSDVIEALGKSRATLGDWRPKYGRFDVESFIFDGEELIP